MKMPTQSKLAAKTGLKPAKTAGRPVRPEKGKPSPNLKGGKGAKPC